MITTRASLAIPAALAVLALLAGCGEHARGGAGTIPATSNDSNSSNTSEPSNRAKEATELDDLAGRELTADEIRSALPPISTLPTGWSVDPDDTLLGEDEEQDSDDDIVTPERCAAVFESLEEVNDLEAKSNGGAGYTRGDGGPLLAVKIDSFAEEVDDEALGRTLDALSDCSTFTLDALDGNGPIDYEVSPLSVANLGEETAALRLSFATEGFDITTDYVFVRAGHNLVAASSASFDGAGVDPDVLESAIEATMKRLANS